MSRYFIYCRKSTEAEDRQVLSIESQTAAMHELATKLNLSVVEVLTEAKSAKAPGRPVFQELMERLYRREADGIICWKLDRLARNPVDGGSIIWAIKQHGIKVLTPAQSFSREEDNVILMYIEFGMAQKYVDDLSKNVLRGLKTKTEKGWFPSIAPLGYVNYTDNLTGERRIITDQERFPLVRKMWDLMLTGLYTPPQILDLANNHWGLRTRSSRRRGERPLGRSSLYDLFTRPFYYGWFEYPTGSGKWFEGRHEPMITQAEYERVQTLLGRLGNPRPHSDLEFAFTGLIRCGACNYKVTAEEKHQVRCPKCSQKFARSQRSHCPTCGKAVERIPPARFHNYTYYHCSRSRRPRCRQPSVSKAELERQIDAFLVTIEISPEFKQWGVEHLHELHERERGALAATVEVQQKALAACETSLANLVKLYTCPGNVDRTQLSEEEYNQCRSELLKEKAQLVKTPQAYSDAADAALKGTERIFEFTCAVRKRFREGGPAMQKEILDTVASNLVLTDKNLSIEATKPFLILQNTLGVEVPEKSCIEPPKTLSPQWSNIPLLFQSSLMWGVVDDVRTAKVSAERAAALIYAHFKRQFGLPSPLDKEMN